MAYLRPRPCFPRPTNHSLGRTIEMTSIKLAVYRGHTQLRCAFPVRGLPFMTSALRGEGGVSPKEDVVREVA